jgi:heme A synthase
LWWLAEQSGDRILCWAGRASAGLLLAQYFLGVTTVLLSFGKIPLFWGSLHQAVAVLVLAAVLAFRHRLGQPP